MGEHFSDRIRGELGRPFGLIMGKFRSRHRVKKVRFPLKNSIFHLSRTFFLEGPNYVNFSSFQKHHFFTEKRQGLNYVKIKTFFFLAVRPIRTLFLNVPKNADKQATSSFTTCRVRLVILCLVEHIADKGVTWRRVALAKKTLEKRKVGEGEGKVLENYETHGENVRSGGQRRKG